MDRHKYNLRHKVTDHNLNQGQSNIEQMQQRMLDALTLSLGMINGGEVIAQAPASGSVEVASLIGMAMVSARRLYTPGQMTISLANGGLLPTASGGSATGSAIPNVALGTEERWISLGIIHAFAETNPELDGTGNTIYFTQTSSWRFKIVAGTKAAIGAAVQPLLSEFDDGILLADLRELGDGTFADEEIYDDRVPEFSWGVGSSIATTGGYLRDEISFDDGDLTAGVFQAAHSLGVMYPAAVSLYDNNGNQVDPDEITPFSTSRIDIDLSSQLAARGETFGTWYLVMSR